MAEAARLHIDRIRKTKFSIGGAENPLTEDLHQAVKNLSAELYAKDVHFLMELIQNSEDNEYPEGVDPSLEFVITSDDITATGAPATLMIFNNEKGFSEKNIDSICSVGRSTKKGNRKRGYIGEKGIGFKSVFLITSQPYIFSNGYQIRFNEAPCPHCSLGYIVPEWVDQQPSLDEIRRIYGSGSELPTTTIILPLKADKVKPVKEQLSQIHPEVLLFLSKIKCLSVREHCQDPRLCTVNSIGIVSETDFMTRKSMDAESYTVHLSAHGNGKESGKECSYYMWRQKFPVKPENRVERRMEAEDWVITLAFPFGERLGKGISSPGVYAFLPTEMVTNLPFIIQADFILASSRETILLDDKWNQGILECVASVFVNSFTSLVKKTDAPVSSLLPVFKFLPTAESSYPKLNAVRESIRARISQEEIVPSVPHLGQKFFHRPCEVGRLIPAFWDILEKAKREGANLQNISSHGTFILDSTFDAPENDKILDFLGLKRVSDEWYAKCIQGCNLVSGITDETYVELLLFIAENWQSRFRTTSMVNVPLVKYMVKKGVSSLCSISKFSPRTLCVSPTNHQAWLLDWNEEFRCMSTYVFMPESTRKSLRSCPKKQVILDWLKEKIDVADFKVCHYAKKLKENLGGERGLAVAYVHFLYHSLSKELLSEGDVDACCHRMPLVDNYGNLNRKRDRRRRSLIGNGVLVPASVSKWVSLIGSNPWRQDGYIELGEDYLRSGKFAGISSGHRQLLEFLKIHVKSEDIPYISPPDAALPAVSGALRKENAFLLLEWIRNLKMSRSTLPVKFLNSIKEGSWLRTSLDGFSDYRPPFQSFFHTSSWGDILQNGSVLVDIPLVDRSFYGDKITNYMEELRTVGVMFEFSEACAFVGKHLMRLAATSSLSKTNVFSILQFIRYLRSKCLPPSDFIKAIKGGRWLRTTSGDRSPDGAVLFSQEWKSAKLISDIPFISNDFYGDAIEDFKEELELLGVVVRFHDSHSLIIAYLNSSRLSYLTADAMFLVLECMRRLSPSKLVAALSNASCFKTYTGYRCPRECFIPDPDWGCLLKVFNCFSLIDEVFYGSIICRYREELKQIGVVVQFEDAVKAFVSVFKQKASSSAVTKDSALSLLSCYRKLMQNPHRFPQDLKNSVKEFKWLRTKLGDFRSPEKCILFDPDWEPLRLICNLPLIDDGPNWYGNAIHDYKSELMSLGVVAELSKGVDYVFNSLVFPSDPSRIAASSVLSLLKCIAILRNERLQSLSKEFLERVSVKWLKTYAGYLSPRECLLFDQNWELNPTDGPFIDEGHYGPEIKSRSKELEAIGVTLDANKACQLLASRLYEHSDSDAIIRMYRFLNKFGWSPEKGASPGHIWIPSDGGSNVGRWAEVSQCVLYDKDKLFKSNLHVLENHYDSKSDNGLFIFFSAVLNVRTNPSLEDYCELWKDWEGKWDKLSSEDCCSFWRFVLKHSHNTKAQEFLSESLTRLPVNSTGDRNEIEEEEVLLCNKSDVFIADDLLLKDLFKNSPVFVWYPQPSIPTLPRTKLLQLYRKIGVQEISKRVEMKELDLPEGVEPEEKKPEDILIGPGLVRLILGFLSDPSLNIESEERSRYIQCLLKDNLKVLETPETISAEYTLRLSTKTLSVKAEQMIRWDREKAVVYAQKMERSSSSVGKKKLLEYATCFAEVIAKGVMWEREDLIGKLSELIKMGYLLEFDEEAVQFLMKSKNLQVYEEDEKLISDAFSPK
ncbi:PREDICTED: uncharacterized protein LOC104821528 [Tarenaya hassleriana]|uniref:uncharacterized protein LOC104821528 n=1 Tax=Tarenaya hassleriana TaxID=28532 RepID=UPI00053C515F|nr:PREDICTED: uncharacterized protein LOC104821528 [Tarenaya hassleriana]